MKNNDASTIFNNIEIMLVGPQGPGNIGSVARAMMNTGFSRLTLVDPVEFDCNEAWSMACNASENLKGARVVKTLEEGLKDVKYAAASSRRKGKLRHPTLSLEEATDKILNLAKDNRVAILFGREDKGLVNEEIEKCEIVFEIPTSDEYPSLNLSHAVFVVCYHLFQSTLPPVMPTIELAERNEVDLMFTHLDRALKHLGYGQDDKGGEYLLNIIMKNFKRLFGRTAIMPKEVQMLRGVLAKIEEKTLK
ncbi:MAG: RNA methyltransferase [Deltaproteobacteria bacterium]|nr:RNA methyltransferase [Deltaproteobacteria bacterium]